MNAGIGEQCRGLRKKDTYVMIHMYDTYDLIHILPIFRIVGILRLLRLFKRPNDKFSGVGIAHQNYFIY